MTPYFSVVVPAYNREQTVGMTIQSVLSQDEADFELLIVDDGSTDGTFAVVSQFEDARIHYYYQHNRGRCAARNTGARHARGTYLVFLDSDDEASTGWLSHYRRKTEADGVGIVCCGLRICDETGQETELRLPEALGPTFGNVSGLFMAGTFCVRRELFLGVSGYVEMLEHSENTELSLRLIPACLAAGLSVETILQPLLTYHRTIRQTSGALAAQLAASEYLIEHHGPLYLAHNRRALANRYAVAGVTAARLGNFVLARRYLRSAYAHDRRSIRNFMRLLCAIWPWVGMKVWHRHQKTCTTA